jgi:site-specific DNA-methyltransferase (adenine-specific)
VTATAPYYEEGGITIYCGEALEVLPTLADGSVDAVITDPPYSSGGFTRSDRSSDPADKYVQSGVDIVRSSFSGDNRDARSWCYWSALWLSECQRIVKVSGYALMFTDWRQLPLASDALQAGGFVWRGIISWDKTEGARAPHTGYFRHQCEYLVWGTNGVSTPADYGGPWPGAFRFPTRQADKFHMTGKPTDLMSQLVQCVPPGGLVVDPFAGSGTTALAAKLYGCRAICIEKEQSNCDIAVSRLAQGVLFGVA